LSTTNPTNVSIDDVTNSPLPTGSIISQLGPNPENLSNVEPTVIPQVGFESGKPNEVSNVSVSGQQPVKLSNLKPIYSVSKGTVALTIDDGPTKYTEQLLKVLKEKGIHVTFFFLGQNATAYPKSVTEAAYDGDEIGYHSNSHPNMTKGPGNRI
jgi:peptidoglycan/xylan/chitin deacetylase (PgdA/CDA1 family)